MLDPSSAVTFLLAMQVGLLFVLALLVVFLCRFLIAEMPYRLEGKCSH